jgi:hypothetical protein
MPLGGIQPITGKMADLTNGILHDEPSDAEVEYFSTLNATFQPILLVLSLALFSDDDGTSTGVPYAISNLPMSKRGTVTTVNIHSIKAHRGGAAFQETDWAYAGFDPFVGQWEAFSEISTILGLKGGKGYVDELGLVVGMYYLHTDFDRSEVSEFDGFLPDERSRIRFLRNRLKTIYQPFKKVETRRIWGAQTPIELFLYQELLYRGLRPELQRLVFPDGRTYPSLYDAYADIELRHDLQLVTEIDIFFPDQRLAVFCDGTHHSRRRQREKDKKIDEQLAALDITSLRISGTQIINDLKAAADIVCSKL